MAFYPAARLYQLEDGFRTVFRAGQRQLLLIQHQGVPYILDRMCPHQGFPLDQGQVNSGRLVCPRHGFTFRLKDGDCMPATNCPLQVFPVAYEGDMLGVDLPDS